MASAPMAAAQSERRLNGEGTWFPHGVGWLEGSLEAGAAFRNRPAVPGYPKIRAGPRLRYEAAPHEFVNKTASEIQGVRQDGGMPRLTVPASLHNEPPVAFATTIVHPGAFRKCCAPLSCSIARLAIAGSALAATDIETCRDNQADAAARLTACKAVIADDKVTGRPKAFAFWFAAMPCREARL